MTTIAFAANHELPLMNTFFNTSMDGISHTFDGWGKKRTDYILTMQRDQQLVRDVGEHPQPSFLPISVHNAVAAHNVKQLDRFANNCPVRRVSKPSIDRRRLTTDPHLREEVATTTGDRLRAPPLERQQRRRRGSHFPRGHHADCSAGCAATGT